MLLQSIAIVAFLVSLLHASYKAIYSARDRRILERRELRWRQSEQANQILKDVEADEYAKAAMVMLDYEWRRVCVAGEKYEFTHERIDKALRTFDLDTFTDDEIVIRDCYDHLFYHYERIEGLIQVELISIYDVVFPIGYFAEAMADRRNVFESYLKEYDYTRALELVGMFKAWGGSLTSDSRPPAPVEPNLIDRIREFLLNVELPDVYELARRLKPGPIAHDGDD